MLLVSTLKQTETITKQNNNRKAPDFRSFCYGYIDIFDHILLIQAFPFEGKVPAKQADEV